jgi:hypothetical protein
VLTRSPPSCVTVSIRHEISTLTNLCASGRTFGIGGKDDVTFGLIIFSTFPWLVFIFLGMCFVRLARANLSFLSPASGRADVVLEACATSVVAVDRSGEGEDDLLEDADDEEDEEDEEEEDELEIVLFLLLDTAFSFSISSNSL